MDSTDARSGEAQYLEVWNDLISVRDLIGSLVICAGATALGLLTAHLLSSSAFFWGLGGSVVGFIIAAVVVTPKRDVRVIRPDESGRD